MATPSEEGQPREDAPQPPETMSPAPPSRRARIAGAVALSIIVVVFATLFYTLSHKGFSTTTTVSSPTNWKTYRDPSGYFSVSIPADWTVQRDTSGKITVSTPLGSYSTPTLFDTMGKLPLGKTSIIIRVDVTPLPNDLARQMACQGAQENPPHYDSTIAGLPAIHFGENTWLFTSNAADFQIDYAYPNAPGDAAIPGPIPTATPMPPGFYDRGQQEIQTIIASFQPIPDTPLACK